VYGVVVDDDGFFVYCFIDVCGESLGVFGVGFGCDDDEFFVVVVGDCVDFVYVVG